eukprot:jgi/Botrbrau1/19352/Bobra.0826s0001.1
MSVKGPNGVDTYPVDYEDLQPLETRYSDVHDLDPPAPPVSDRDQIVQTLEEARFQHFHLKALAITSLTFFSDSYCLFLPTIIAPIIGIVYFRGPPYNGTLPAQQDLLLKGMALVGTILGMIGFGVYGDLVGRKKAFLPTLLLILVSSLGGAFAANTYSGMSMVWILGLWRFVLGIGVGGDYSLNASIITEYSSRHFRGALIGTLFAMQGFGILSAALVAMAVLAGFKKAILADLNALDTVWRIMVGVGAAPVIGALLLRIKLPESPRFTIEINNNPVLAKSNMQALMGFGRVREDLGSEDYGRHQITWASFALYVRRYWIILVPPAMCWLLLDVGYYAQNFLSANVMTGIGHIPAADVHEPETVFLRVFNIAAGQAMLAMMGTIPGYWVTVVLVDRIGRKPIQLSGFAIMTVLFWILALAYPYLLSSNGSKWGFIFLYSLTFFFANFGPNATTFIIPAEVFPTRFRCTCYGICAASGKAGAVIATFGFGSFDRIHRPQAMIGVLSIPMIMGLLMTLLIPETGDHQSLDEIQEKVEDIVKKREAYQRRRRGLEPLPSAIVDPAVHNWVPSPPMTPFYTGPPPPPGYQPPGTYKVYPAMHLDSARSAMSLSPPPSELNPRHSGHSSQNPDAGHGQAQTLELASSQAGSGQLHEGPTWGTHAQDPYHGGGWIPEQYPAAVPPHSAPLYLDYEGPMPHHQTLPSHYGDAEGPSMRGHPAAGRLYPSPHGTLGPPGKVESFVRRFSEQYPIPGEAAATWPMGVPRGQGTLTWQRTGPQVTERKRCPTNRGRVGPREGTHL